MNVGNLVDPAFAVRLSAFQIFGSSRSTHFSPWTRISGEIAKPGLPDFSWHIVPKPEKNVPNEHKIYLMVKNNPKCP
jgi:hypothetical protein